MFRLCKLSVAQEKRGNRDEQNVEIEIKACRSVSDELEEAMNHLIPQLSQSSLPPSRPDLEEIIDNSDNTLLAAFFEGRIVGCLMLVMFRIPTGLRARIEDVVVDETVRGNRIAERLSIEALKLARISGARNVDLTSRPTRVAANRLYMRMGFELRDSNVYRYTL